MATIELTAESFEATVSQDGIVLVDFWAPWCAPCRMFGPVFEASSAANLDVVHAKVDTESQSELGGALGITSIPTLMGFRDGVLVYRQAGALPAPALKQVVDAIKDLDMDEVNKRIAEHKGAA